MAMVVVVVVVELLLLMVVALGLHAGLRDPLVLLLRVISPPWVISPPPST